MIGLWTLVTAGWCATVQLPGTAQQVEVADEAVASWEVGLTALGAGAWTDAAERFRDLAAARADPALRYLEGAAWFEGGDLRAAERVAGEAVETWPDHAPLALLKGLVLTELGRGREALGLLGRARDGAEDDPVLVARALLAEGVVHDDLGARGRAGEAWTRARDVAASAGLSALATLAEERLASLELRAGDDVVGAVLDRIRRGRRDEAATLAESAEADSRGTRVRQAVARAIVARSEGRLDAAADLLRGALVEGAKGGLLRETVAARLELAHVHLLAGARETARQELEAALAQVAGTSLRVREVDVRAALARLDARSRRPREARAHLVAARALAAEAEHPLHGPQLAELEALVLAAEGDLDGAGKALVTAGGGWRAVGYTADAARVAAERVRLLARAQRPTAAAATEAVAALRASGAGAPEAQVALHEGLGRADRGDLEGALEAFARGLELAREAGDRRVAGDAEARVSEALRSLGHDATATRLAAEAGLTDAVERHRTWTQARKLYEDGRAAYDRGDVIPAAALFDEALERFQQLGEIELAAAARRAGAWASWRAAVLGGASDAALREHRRVAALAASVDDEELALRASASAAVVAARLDQAGAPRALREAAARAEAAGEDGLAARCLSELAEVAALSLEARAEAARGALEADVGPDAVYALYSVAVDAYNADELALARDLAAAALPHAGDLAPDVREVLDASRDALGE